MSTTTRGGFGTGRGWYRGLTDEQKAAIQRVMERDRTSLHAGLGAERYRVLRMPSTLNPPWLVLLRRYGVGGLLEREWVITDERGLAHDGRFRPGYPPRCNAARA